MGPHGRTGPRRGPGTVILAAAALAAYGLSGCTEDTRHRLLIDTHEQQMTLLDDGQPIATYPVSTSKFGLGDSFRSNQTPVGLLKVRKKIGDGAPAGTVFKSRKPTGEILAVDAPGRDPIVTRILWLEGLEPQNRNAYDRYIYIHGTPEERLIGVPASYGCIRMRSRDVIDLFDRIGVGARVEIRADVPEGVRLVPFQSTPAAQTPPGGVTPG